MNKPINTNHLVFDLKKIDQLLTEQEAPCVSVVVNLFTAANMLKQNLTNLKRSVQRALKSLENHELPEKTKEHLSVNLTSLSDSFKNSGTAMAVGIFVSPRMAHLLEFPFPVIECSIVGNSFEVRDIMYLQQYLEPYYALNISKDSLRLFKGQGKSLEEVTNKFFPAQMPSEQEYEYEHASPVSSHGYSMKAYEKNKGTIAHLRQESFVKSVARHLSGVINDPHAHLVVTGPARLANEVETVYPYTEYLSRIGQSFNGRNFEKFVDTVWEKVVDARKELMTMTIKRVRELPLNSKAEGLRDVWAAASEGRGLLLLVDRELQRMAYQLDGSSVIRIHPPKERHTVIPDAVDDVIELVRNKHGRVLFTEPGQLRQFDDIVLTLRY